MKSAKNRMELQMIAGVGLPVDLDLESVTMGVVFKSSFILPMNSSDFFSYFSEPFDVSAKSTSKRSIDASLTNGYDEEQNEKYEKYQVEAEVVEQGGNSISSDPNSEINDFGHTEQDSSAETTRWLVYEGLAQIAER